MERTGQEFRDELSVIRREMLAGKLTVEEAKKVAQPIIDEMNARGAKVAKEFGRTFHKLTFGYIMR